MRDDDAPAALADVLLPVGAGEVPVLLATLPVPGAVAGGTGRRGGGGDDRRNEEADEGEEGPERSGQWEEEETFSHVDVLLAQAWLHGQIYSGQKEEEGKCLLAHNISDTAAQSRKSPGPCFLSGSTSAF